MNPVAAVDAEQPISTLPEPRSLPALRRARLARRLGILSLAVLVAAGMSGALGSRTSAVTAAAGGYRLTVTYPSATRPGLPVRWEIEVHHAGGFTAPIQLATSFEYLHLFDISNTEPEAKTSTASADTVVYGFAAPRGDTFRVTMDGNAEPGEHLPMSAHTSLIVDGLAVVSVEYMTVVIP